jgi:hypothetical protein
VVPQIARAGLSVPQFVQVHHAVLHAFAIARGAPATNLSAAEQGNVAVVRTRAGEIEAVFGTTH